MSVSKKSVKNLSANIVQFQISRLKLPCVKLIFFILNPKPRQNILGCIFGNDDIFLNLATFFVPMGVSFGQVIEKKNALRLIDLQ